MRWRDLRRSQNIEDRRGSGRPRIAVGGGLGAIVIVLIVVLLGGDLRALLQSDGLGGSLRSSDGPLGGAPAPEQAEAADFVSVVLGDTELVWHDIFRRAGAAYQEPALVLFDGQVRSACGFASAAVGPFYCPGDAKVYLDLTFFEELDRRFGAPGDFAQAYVIAHEVGHHVQTLLGINERVQAQQQRLSEAESNALSVRLELQADFYAGVWAHHAQRARQILETGDIEEALRAAAAIGDDRLQKQARGYVVPDSFTHGTSAQRLAWFRKGLETGDIRQGDTFTMPDP